MRIAQIVLEGASEFERKCQRVDFAALSAKHDVIVTDGPVVSADVAHVYGPSPLPSRALVGFKIPYVASSAPASRFALSQPARPRVIVSPIEVAGSDGQLLPEAVEEIWFGAGAKRESTPPRHLIASYSRPSIINAVEQALLRIGRSRDDIAWNLFDRIPTPDDLAGVDAWVDPAVNQNDHDGFVAEAIAAGKVVVASRIPINAHRLENGRTGFLVPWNDPNELTHAILSALFKPEVARSKIEAAKQTAGKFRPRQRLRVLERIYETLIQ